MDAKAPGPRELVWGHLARTIGEPKTAFVDANGWSGESHAAGPPIDVICIPPQGDRRFLYLCTFGSCLHPLGAPSYLKAGIARRVEFVTAIAQTPNETANRALLEQAVRHVRSWAKRVHVAALAVESGDVGALPDDVMKIMIGEAGACFLAPRIGAAELAELPIGPNAAISFRAPVPVHASEIKYGQMKGAKALADALERGGATEMLAAHRAPVRESTLAEAAA